MSEPAEAGGAFVRAQGTLSAAAMSSADLLARLVRPADTAIADAPAPLLGVQAGGGYWLLDCVEAACLALPPVTPVPLTRPWLRGLVAIDGALMGVLDLAVYLGGVRTPLTHDSRLLPLPGRPYCLLVGSVVGLRARGELTGVPRPVDSPDFAGPRYRDTRGRFWQVLALDQLAAQPDFMDMCP